MTASPRRILRLAVSNDPQLTSRVLGVLYVAGALLVLMSLFAPLPEAAVAEGLAAVAVTALIVGTASIVMAKRARPWSIHFVLAAGTALICFCVYYAGVATAIYPAMFLWVILVAAHFFSPWAVAAHLGWVLAAWGVTLNLVDDPSGFSVTSRWILGGSVLAVAAAVITELVAGTRSVEDQLREEIEESARLQRELEHLADHDSLTGLANRRRFESELTRELSRSRRHGSPLSVVALDLDRFKQYNDLNGHGAGDLLLKSSAKAWEDCLRAGDLIARVGGDEFIALLPGAPMDEAEMIRERLCEGFPLGIECSAGIACWDGRESAESLLNRADRAMYETKAGHTVTASLSDLASVAEPRPLRS